MSVVGIPFLQGGVDVKGTLAASADVDNFAPAAQMLLEWRATAEVHADPALARRLRGSVDADAKPVRAPRA